MSAEIFRISSPAGTRCFSVNGAAPEAVALFIALHCAGDRVSGSADEAAENCAEMVAPVSARMRANITPLESVETGDEARCFTMIFSRFGLRVSDQSISAFAPSIDTTSSWVEFLADNSKNKSIRDVLTLWERDFVQKPFEKKRAALATA